MDAVIVGSGPNGLAAALTLARAGIRVRVFEQSEVVGGGARSSRLPITGVLVDHCSAFHPLAKQSAFFDTLGDAQKKALWANAPIELSHPLQGKAGAVLRKSVTQTASSLAEDGDQWLKLFGRRTDDFEDLTVDLLRSPVRVPRNPGKLLRFGRLAALPATTVASKFESAPAQALFLGVAAHCFGDLSAPMSASIGVALTIVAQHSGWPVAIGGSSSIVDLIVKHCMDRGVTFHTKYPVTSLSDLPRADLVMLDTSPRSAMHIIGPRLPSRLRTRYATNGNGASVVKMDFAIRDGVPWKHAESHIAGTVHLGGTASEIIGSEAAASSRRHPVKPFVLVGQQYLADPTRSVGNIHPVYAYAHVSASYRGNVEKLIIDRIEEFAPGVRDRIIESYTYNQLQLEADNPNLIGGGIVGGMINPRRLIFGTHVTLKPYRTGVRGIYLCSASTPPGAGAHGMCGYNAAQAALSDMSKTGPSSSTRESSRGIQ